MERHGHLALDPTVRQLLLAVSPATIDRLLATVRAGVASEEAKNLKQAEKQTPFALLRTGMSHCLGTSKSTSFPTAAVQ